MLSGFGRIRACLMKASEPLLKCHSEFTQRVDFDRRSLTTRYDVRGSGAMFRRSEAIRADTNLYDGGRDEKIEPCPSAKTSKITGLAFRPYNLNRQRAGRRDLRSLLAALQDWVSVHYRSPHAFFPFVRAGGSKRLPNSVSAQKSRECSCFLVCFERKESLLEYRALGRAGS